MNNFVLTMLTFLIIGVCLIIIFVYYKRNNHKETKNYLIEGMCLGMGLGVAIAAALRVNVGLGIGLGMLVGETIGILIQKK